jgi:hypothetical protein
METATYNIGGITQNEFDANLEKVWAELQAGGALAKQAADAGIDPSIFKGKALADVVRVDRSPESGFGPEVTAIIVTILVDVAKTLWKLILLPRLENKLGKKAVEEITTTR